MSSEGEKCNFCNRLRNNLNKVNWNRHLAKCELLFSTKITKPNKKSKNDRCGDIKSFFHIKDRKQKIMILINRFIYHQSVRFYQLTLLLQVIIKIIDLLIILKCIGILPN